MPIWDVAQDSHPRKELYSHASWPPSCGESSARQHDYASSDKVKKVKQPITNRENVVPQVEAGETTMAGNRFSIKSFIIAFVFTGAVLAWLSWSTYDLYTQDTIIAGQVWRTEELRGTIIHLDEVLTMSARMAAATGDSQWEARYRKFEPQLDQAIKEILKLAPSQPLAQTDAANLRLVEMENHAFALVRG